MIKNVSLICALARNHAIGMKNGLPWHIPKDFEHFKSLTMGKPVIMGRLTYDSILAMRSGKPLPHRPHYVVSRTFLDNLPDSVTHAPDLAAAIDQARTDYPDSEIMIIGGASIYRQAISMVEKMYLTWVDCDADGDAFFPHFPATEWAETERQDFPDELIPFHFVTYTRLSQKKCLPSE